MNTRKKFINLWDGGVQTSPRDNNPDTSFGAQLVKHFDVYSDPKKLKPMPSWESFTTVAEKAYNIRAMGGLSTDVYGLGSGLSNWYSAKWGYRVQITNTSTVGVTMFDLTQMPSTFWDNVNEDGSDIRVIEVSGGSLKGCDVREFDRDGETGYIWTNSITDFYIYYGYAEAQANSSILTTLTEPFLDNAEAAYSGLGFMFHFDGDTNNAGNTQQNLDYGAAANYTTGSPGQALTGSTVTGTVDDDELGDPGNDPIFGFRFFVPSEGSGSVTGLVNQTAGGLTVDYDGTQINVAFDGAGGTTPLNGTVTITPDVWHSVMVHFLSGDPYIYIDGVLDTSSSSTNDGNYDPSSGAIQVKTVMSTSGNVIVDTFYSDNLTINGLSTALGWHTMITNNSSLFTVGSQIALTSVAKQYSGTQIYTKDITSGDWEEYFINGQPAKISDKYPVNGFIEGTSDLYFIISASPDDEGFLWLAKTGNVTPIDDTHLLLATITASNKQRPTSESPVDGSTYFTHTNSNLGEVADPGSTNVYGAGGTIISQATWRNYLALGYTRRTRAFLELWDLVQANAVEKIDAGTGNLRIAGNASDLLFAVVDNYIDDAVLSSNTPTMELKQYVGNGRMDSAVRIEIPSTYTGWTDDWERAVSFFKVRRNDTTLFYAKLPADDTATTFNEGFWAVGKNSQGKLALTLLIDTSDFSSPENVYGFAQQVFFIEKDGGIQRLATDGSYDKTSVYKTLWMNESNTEIEKSLAGIELATEPLEAGQTITVYATYRINGTTTTRKQVGEFTGTDKIAYESVLDSDSANLPSYQEIYFELESTGGKSAILEFNYVYEYEGDLV